MHRSLEAAKLDGLRARFPFLSGVGSIGSGVFAAGICTYLFLSLAGRVLGPAHFAPVSTLWALVFIVGPGLFLPVQQELGRIVAGRRSTGGAGHAVRRVALLAGGIAATTMLAGLFAGPWLVHELFDGDWALLWCFEGSVAAYAVTFLARGVLSGAGHYVDFGRLVAVESLTRLIVGASLALAGWRSAAAFGLSMALAPFVSTALITRLGKRLRLAPGDPVSWGRATRALGWLLAGSLLAQFLANAGPLAVQLLAGPAEASRAGVFLSALVVARLTLYLFQAVQATLLPNLAQLVAERRIGELTRALHRMTVAGAVLVLVSTVGALFFGTLAVRILFGESFGIGHRTMAVLAGASSIYVLAMALSGGAIAAGGHRLNAVAWLSGAAAFIAGTAVTHGAFVRVEMGYLLGSAVVAGVLLAGLPTLVRRATQFRMLDSSAEAAS